MGLANFGSNPRRQWNAESQRNAPIPRISLAVDFRGNKDFLKPKVENAQIVMGSSRNSFPKNCKFIRHYCPPSNIDQIGNFMRDSFPSASKVRNIICQYHKLLELLAIVILLNLSIKLSYCRRLLYYNSTSFWSFCFMVCFVSI